MILDLTTKISSEQREKWIGDSKEPHVKSGHIGTHLDTYCKTQIPLEYFKSRGVFVDVTDFCGEREIEVADLAKLSVSPDSFVIFRTGQIERYAYGSEEYFNEHPQLSKELIRWLLERKIRFIGIDCAGIRRGEEHRPADILCEEKGVYVIENMCNMGELGSGDFTVYTMWLNDPDMTGLKCRIIAEMQAGLYKTEGFAIE